MPLKKEDISPNLVKDLVLQEYTSAKSIVGVRLIPFDLHVDDGGDLHELARINNGLVSSVETFELKQINRSRFNAGLVKAFHLHFSQDEIWAVHPLDRLLVGLLDVRKGSQTEGVRMRLVLGGGKSNVLYIPRGVAHGGMSLDNKPVDVIYLTNQHFSISDPDEWRLSWKMLGDDFWKINHG